MLQLRVVFLWRNKQIRIAKLEGAQMLQVLVRFSVRRLCPFSLWWGHVSPTFTNGWAREQKNCKKKQTDQTLLTIAKALTKTTNCTRWAKNWEGYNNKSFLVRGARHVPPLLNSSWRHCVRVIVIDWYAIKENVSRCTYVTAMSKQDKYSTCSHGATFHPLASRARLLHTSVIDAPVLQVDNWSVVDWRWSLSDTHSLTDSTLDASRKCRRHQTTSTPWFRATARYGSRKMLYERFC